jgi:hypothetical protein
MLGEAKRTKWQAVFACFVQTLQFLDQGKVTAMYAVKVAKNQAAGYRGKLAVRIL